MITRKQIVAGTFTVGIAIIVYSLSVSWAHASTIDFTLATNALENQFSTDSTHYGAFIPWLIRFICIIGVLGAIRLLYITIRYKVFGTVHDEDVVHHHGANE